MGLSLEQIRDGPPIIVFDYQTGRAGAHARAFPEGRRGHLMVDDYAVYKALFADGVTGLACMVHSPSKFFELHAAIIRWGITAPHAWLLSMQPTVATGSGNMTANRAFTVRPLPLLTLSTAGFKLS